jgi:hypothetical protein
MSTIFFLPYNGLRSSFQPVEYLQDLGIRQGSSAKGDLLAAPVVPRDAAARNGDGSNRQVIWHETTISVLLPPLGSLEPAPFIQEEDPYGRVQQEVACGYDAD